MTNLIKSEFTATRAPMYSGQIQNFTDLKSHAIEKGFTYAEKMQNGYRFITLSKNKLSTDILILPDYIENYMTMSILLCNIREKLSRQK